MKIDVIKVGNLMCNCYILSKDNNVLVIDPGDEVNKIVDFIGNRNVVGIIITHHHFDHDGAMKELAQRYNTSIYDRYSLDQGVNNIDDFSFEVIYTPGHKEDLITIYFKEFECMFCGDFIFRESIGRCDLPGGDIKEMINSINRIKKYNRNIKLYPGHGEKTTLGYEIDNNIYFRDVELL